MNARISRLRQALFLPLLLVVGCNVSDSRDQAAPEPGTALLVPRIIASSGELPITDSVQVLLELDGKPSKDTALVWSDGSLRLRSVKYGTKWKLVARGFLNPKGAQRWIVWVGSDSGTMSEETKSTKVDRAKIATIVADNLMATPAVSMDGGDLPGSFYAGSAVTIKVVGAKSVAWSTDGRTPACESSSTSNSVDVRFDSAMTDSVTLRYVACADGSASPVGGVRFKVVARPADAVGKPRAPGSFDTLSVGQSFVIEPDTGARISVTLDGAAPACEGDLPETATVAYDSTKAGKTVTVKAVSCKGGRSSLEWSKPVYMRPKGVLAAPSLVGDPVPTVGTSFRVAPAAGARVAYTTDKSKVFTCATASALLDTATILVTDAAMGDSVVVRAFSCKDGASSAEFRKAFHIPVPMPAIETRSGASVTGSMKAGDTIVFKAYAGTKVAYTTDDSTPKCATAKMQTATYVIGKVFENKTLPLKAVSCKDSVVGSAVRSVSVPVVPAGTVVMEVEIPSGYDTASSAVPPVISWETPIVLTIPKGTTLRWKLAVDTIGKITPSDWANLGVPGASSDSGKTLVVARGLLARIPGTDTSASVIAVAVLLDSVKAPKDTVRLRWTIRGLQQVPVPDVSVVRTEGSVAFVWSRAGKTGYAAWYSRGGATDSAATIEVGAADTVSLSVTSGQNVSLRVVATDSATGRSVQRTVNTSALRPPRKPGFTVRNTSQTNGTVEVKLDAATLADSAGVVLKLGYANSGVATCDKPVVKGAWTGDLNAGDWTVRVCATRDSVTKDSSVTSFKVVKVGPPSPESPKNLRLLARDSNALTWKWDSVPGHVYLVFKKSGTITSIEGLKADTVRQSTFRLASLKAGDSLSIAVVALMTSDSSGGNSTPAISPVAYTKIPPPAPKLSARVEDNAQGTYRVNLLGCDPACVWDIGIGRSDKSLQWKSIASSAVQKVGDTSYVILSDSTPGSVWLGLRATRDSIVKSTIATSALVVKKTSAFTPKQPEGLEVTRTNEKIILRWTGRSGYQYRVFRSESSGDLLTANDTLNSETVLRQTLPVGQDSFELPFGGTYTNPYRFAVQTVYAPDSTKGPSPLAAINSEEVPVTPGDVTWMTADACGSSACVLWNGVANATGYKISFKSADSVKYSMNVVGSSVCDAGNCMQKVPFSDFPSGINDYRVEIVGTNGSQQSATPGTDDLHIPQLLAAPKTTWEAWITMNNLYIAAKTSDNMSVYPDVQYTLRKRTGTDTIWKSIALNNYPNQNSWFLGSQLPTNGMIEYMVVYKFKWVGGAQDGDSTKLDTLKDASGNIVYLRRLGPPPVPKGYLEIKQGKHYLTLTSLKNDTAGMSPRRLVLRMYRTDTYDSVLVDLSKGATSLEYPLGVKSIEAAWVYGKDVSNWSANTVLAKDRIVKQATTWGDTIFYRTTVVNGRSWMLEPLAESYVTPSLTWLQAMKLETVPTALGDVSFRQGICPEGWSVPTKSEFDSLFKAMNPNAVNWATEGSFQDAFKALQIEGANPHNIFSSSIVTSGIPSLYQISSVNYNVLWVPEQGSQFSGYTRVYCIKAP